MAYSLAPPSLSTTQAGPLLHLQGSSVAGWLLDNVLGCMGYVKTLLHTKANVGACYVQLFRAPGQLAEELWRSHFKLKNVLLFNVFTERTSK